MPIYRYRCEGCMHEAELIQSLREGEEYQKTEPKCPGCGASEWHRLISLGSFRLQGGGWFKDGY